MIAVLAVATALSQGAVWIARPAAPTVGDTVVVERVLPTAPGAMGRTRPLEPGDVLQPLGRPVLEPHPDGLLVRHRFALFSAGEHVLPMPAIEVLHPDGTVEIVLGDTAVVAVVSVIPDTARNPAPMPSQGPLARPVHRPGRAVLPVALVAAVLIAWLLWRRRSPGVAVAADGETPLPELPLMRWLQSGERRAVATLAAHRIREAVRELVPESARAASPDEWQALVADAAPSPALAELADVLRALERARFAPLGADDLVELVDRADVALGHFRGALATDGEPA